MLTIAVQATAGGAQGPSETREASHPPRSAGLVTLGRDGRLQVASAARIDRKPGLVDKIGSFLSGLGYGSPDYESPALCLVGLTPRGTLDSGFGANGSTLAPLPPLGNRDEVAVTALLEDEKDRTIVVGWRSLSKGFDANFLAIVAARFTVQGALDPSFGERGFVTTRIDRDGVTQALAATLDGEGRLLVAGYNGGENRDKGRMLDDWPIRVVLLRYTANGSLDPSFGTGGIASRVLVPGRPNEHTGRDFLRYDSGRTKAMGLTLDRQGRPVVAAAGDDGAIFLLRTTREGAFDSSFGIAGTVRTPVVGKLSGASSLLWDDQGRLLAAGTSDNNVVLLRYFVDGAPDTSFGDGGIRRTPIGEGMRVSAALREGDGHVLLVASGNESVQVVRYDREGRPAQAPETSGVVSVALGRSVAMTAGLAVDDTGTPVVTVASRGGIFFLRFNRGGLVDKEFLPLPAARP